MAQPLLAWLVSLPQRCPLASALLLVLLGLGLRLFRLGEQSLWLDEAFSLWRAGLPLPELVSFPELHPPLYYLLLHYWAPLGEGEAHYRLPSAAAGAASIALTYWTWRDVLGRQVALLSALLLALAPLHVWYSQEARMYALAGALALLSFGLFDRYQRAPSIEVLGMGLLATAAAVLTSYSVLLVWAGMVTMAVCRLRSQGLQPWLPWLLAQVLLFAVLFPQLSPLLERWHSGSFTGARIRLVAGPMADPLLVFGLAGLLLCIAMMMGTVSNLRLGQAKERGLAGLGGYGAWAGLGLYFMVTVASLWPGGHLIKRQLLVALPFVITAAACSLHRLPRFRAAVLAGMVLMSAVGLTLGYWVHQKEQWREVGQLLERQAGTHDVIWLHGDSIRLPFRLYYHGPATVQEVGLDTVHRESLPQSTEHLWLVISQERHLDPDGQVEAYLLQRLQPVEEHIFHGVRVRAFRIAGLTGSAQVVIQSGRP